MVRGTSGTRTRDVHQTIDVTDAANCHFWARALGVNIADLKKAVHEVGTRPEEVRQFLAIRHNRRVQRETT